MRFSIRPVQPAEAAVLGSLFTQYPHKTAQQVAQRLDRTRLEAFYLAGLERSLKAGTAMWLAERRGEIVALAGLTGDPWHSEVYGIRMGKLAPWLNTIAPEAGKALLKTALDEARNRGLEHLSVRVDGEDFPNLHLLEAAGWLTIDVSMKFSLPMERARHPLGLPGDGNSWKIRLASPGDSDWIRRLGSTTHGGTHFLNDPALPVEKTRELFARWIDRCVERLAWRIYVLEDPQGQGQGFVIYLRNRGFAQAVGREPLILDFVLVSPAVRTGGLGSWLIAESLAREAEEGFDFCELRTSAHNLSAVACYEKLGFRCCATDFVLHKRLGR